MRIVFSSGIFPPDIGGPASYVPAMAAALVSRGHNVDVVCLSDSLDHDDTAYPFRVHRIMRSERKPRRIVRTIRQLTSLARRADVVYANTLSAEAAASGFAAAKPVVQKVVGDYAWERAQNWGWYTGTLDSYQTSRKTLRLHALDVVRNRPLRSAAAIITPSSYLQQIVQGWGVCPARIRVVYNAVDGASTAPAPALPPHDGPTILTACRLTPWKGIEGLLEALRRLPSARLVVAGDGPLRATLQEISERAGLRDRVVWLGFVTASRLRALYDEIDVFVLNSTYEGLPHVVIEAMSAGCAVVATAAGGTPEVVIDGMTGRLVPVGDAEALTTAIRSLLANPDEAARLREAAKAYVGERFSFEAMVQSTEAVLLRAAAG